jgi:hypothetical protein
MGQREAKDAIIDNLRLKAGVINRTQCHPLMDDVIAGHYNHGEVGVTGALPQLAEMCTGPASASGRSRTYGASTSDYAQILAPILQEVVEHHLSKASRFKRICKKIEVKDFRGHAFPAIGLDFELDEETRQGEAFAETFAVEVVPGVTAKLGTYGKNFAISREVTVNDQSEKILSSFARAGVAAGRLMAKLVYAVLESNPALGDGTPLFHSSFGNDLPAADLDLNSVGEAMAAAERSKTKRGIEADVTAKFIVVPSELKATALSVVHNNNLKLEVVSTSRLSASGYWYLLGDPDIAPVIGLLNLENQVGGLSVGEAPKKGTYDGVVLGLRHYTGVAPLGRTGAVRRAIA